LILADRSNRIISEQQISKAEFARRIGVTPQYMLLLTGNAKARPESIKPALAKRIALEFDCDTAFTPIGEEERFRWLVCGNTRTAMFPSA